MDPTTRFFAQLKKLAVTLESETAKLQHAFENRHNEDDSESNQRGMRAYHELKCEVGDLKGQIQKQLAEQKAEEKEVGNFIEACKVMEQRVTTDVQALKEYFQKYGYQPPQDSQKTTSTNCQESDDENVVADEEAESKSAREEGGSQEEEDETKINHPSSPPLGGPPPVTDFLRTPQLADFGLSEMQLKRSLAGAEWCSEVPPMPQISLPQASVDTPAPPPMPLTPKCALRMDDDELLTPQMQAFGISEHTMCLINDFTMDLFQKNIDKPRSRPPQDVPEPVNQLMETLQAKENLESPEPPVFCTPGFKIKKTKSHCSPPEQISADPESPVQIGKAPTTPEIPVLQTPYLKHLVSSKKSARQPESVSMQTNDENHAPKLPTPAANGNTSGKRECNWECNVPEISFQDLDDGQMPEMPNLESVLAKSLQSKNVKMLKRSSEHESVIKEPAIRSLEIDGPTQEFSFGTPRLRKDFEVPNTPEMPDLSSVTQDICKLVSQAQLKRTAMAVVQPNVREDKENISARSTVVSVPSVSESEFQSLPGYLRLMTLHNLNQAIHSINKFTADGPREKTEFQMEELRRITNVGAKTPVYILCLTELKRLVHVGGTKNASVYKLCTQN